MTDTELNGDVMTSAEFKCLREKLGLTTNWLSKRWDVADNSVKRWERGRTLPAELEADMRSLLAEFNTRVTAACAACGPDAAIIVPRIDADVIGDRPAAWHHAVAQAVCEKTGCRILFLKSDGISSDGTGYVLN